MTNALPLPLRYLPWRFVSAVGRDALDREFSKAIDATPPDNSAAYFWPDPPIWLVEQARPRGLLAVREMINCYQGTAKRILDQHQKRLSLAPLNNITDASIARERIELKSYDYIFASNDCVEQSLSEAGVAAQKILRTSFGWVPAKYRFSAQKRQRRESPGEVRALFVGSICARKGVPYLLEAWKESRVPGKLVLAGNIERGIEAVLSRYSDDNSIELVNYVEDLSALYNSADVFVFPTLEEGGPQVVYEAAGAGLPIITTPMGRGRIVEDGVNGLVVDPGDVAGLAAAIAQLGFIT